MSRKVYHIKKVWEQEVLSKIRYPVLFIPVNEVNGNEGKWIVGDNRGTQNGACIR